MQRGSKEVNKEIEDLKAQIEWHELKERLHLRLISGGNDELARRGERIVYLEGELKRAGTDD